jgi:outer membrane lipoprotein SlyB
MRRWGIDALAFVPAEQLSTSVQPSSIPNPVQHNVGQLVGGHFGRAAGTAVASTSGTGGALAPIAPFVVSGPGVVGSRVGDEFSRKIKVASNFLTYGVSQAHL